MHGVRKLDGRGVSGAVGLHVRAPDWRGVSVVGACVLADDERCVGSVGVRVLRHDVPLEVLVLVLCAVEVCGGGDWLGGRFGVECSISIMMDWSGTLKGSALWLMLVVGR